MSSSRTQRNIPGQTQAATLFPGPLVLPPCPDRWIRNRAHQPCGHPASTKCNVLKDSYWVNYWKIWGRVLWDRLLPVIPILFRFCSYLISQGFSSPLLVSMLEWTMPEQWNLRTSSWDRQLYVPLWKKIHGKELRKRQDSFIFRYTTFYCYGLIFVWWFL